MRHDTPENNCDPSLYIMSPTLGSGKITWSQCSRNYLRLFLEYFFLIFLIVCYYYLLQVLIN